MLHVTTEVGQVGKKEREKRHFPARDNIRSEPVYKARGRRYIPHNYGTYMDWVPHGQYIEPKLTDSGPDWSSRLRYIPDPENPEYPAAEIWENNWHSMRPYPCNGSTVGYNTNNSNNKDNASINYLDLDKKRPFPVVNLRTVKTYEIHRPYDWFEEGDSGEKEPLVMGDRGKRTYQRTNREWLLDPGLSTRMRCVFNGVHKASATSEDELTHSMAFGKGRPETQVDKRNGLPMAAPGDKSYQVPEYSPSFHRLGSTRPATRYGPARSLRTPDTFIPLMVNNNKPRETYKYKEKGREQQVHIEEVKRLDTWRPATPLNLTIPVVEKFEEVEVAKGRDSKNSKKAQ